MSAPGGAPRLPGFPDRFCSQRRRSSREVYEAIVTISSCRTGANATVVERALGRCNTDELVRVAIAEGLAGIVLDRCGEALDPAPRGRLQTVTYADTAQHLAYMNLLGKIGEALDSIEVGWGVLKGPVLTERCFEGVSRSYSDLDLIVAPCDLEAAIRALQGLGAQLAVADWAELTQSAKGQLSMGYHGLPLIDLHWHLVYLRSCRNRFRIPTHDLLERRRRIRLAGRQFWTLEPTDFAIHVALHASFAGVQRLRRLLDVERTLAHGDVDWAEFVQRCRDWRVSLPVGVSLRGARDLLGAQVPDAVLADLARGPLGRLIVRELSGWVPIGRLPGGRSVRTGLMRSLRDGAVATAIQFGVESSMTVDAMIRGSGGVGRHKSDPTHGDGQAALEDFLDMVKRMDRYGRSTAPDRRRPDLSVAPVGTSLRQPGGLKQPEAESMRSRTAPEALEHLSIDQIVRHSSARPSSGEGATVMAQYDPVE